jgi:hypothetical protein
MSVLEHESVLGLELGLAVSGPALASALEGQ